MVYTDNEHEALAFVRRGAKEKLLVALNRSGEEGTLTNFPHRKGSPAVIFTVWMEFFRR